MVQLIRTQWFTTEWLVTGIIALVTLERLIELRINGRNVRWLLARGAQEFGAEHYPYMVALHASFLVAVLLELWLLRPEFRLWLFCSTIVVLMGTMGVRYWVIATLGHRWSTRVLVLPELPPLQRGPFRWLRHPNYVAVALEILALPLLHGAWRTAVAYSLANAILLAVRIRIENHALYHHSALPR